MDKNLSKEQVKEIALTLTGAYEGASFTGITGNFDGQLMSCGVLQWCLGQGSLQAEILKPFITKYENREAETTLKIPLLLSGAMTKEAWADYIMKNPTIYATFKALLATPEMREVQLGAASKLFDKAWNMVGGLRYGVRGVLWAFDIVVQNGSLKSATIPIEVPYEPLCWAEIAGMVDVERGALNIDSANYVCWSDWLKIKCESVDVAAMGDLAIVPLVHATFARANLANPTWKKDVLSRKLTALFGRGYVHGTYYNIESVISNVLGGK